MDKEENKSKARETEDLKDNSGEDLPEEEEMEEFIPKRGEFQLVLKTVSKSRIFKLGDGTRTEYYPSIDYPKNVPATHEQWKPVRYTNIAEAKIITITVK